MKNPHKQPDQMPERAGTAMIVEPTPSLLDREINSATSDAFGHRHFARALQSLIEDPNHQPPYSIGLLGRWGTGKSSIKAMYLASLQDDTERQRLYHAVTFNAWRFGGENVKRALLRHVYLALGGETRSLADALFSTIKRTVLERRTWREVGKSVLDQWIVAPIEIAVFVVCVVGVFILSRFAKSLLHISGSWPSVVVAVLVFGLLGFATVLVRSIADSRLSLVVPLFTPATREETPATASEQYEDLLMSQLGKFKKSKSGKHCKRLVIFVDDLDRLSSEEMVNGLDAIRTFMEMPSDKLPSGLGIIFVISCDEEKITAALNNRQNRRTGDLPGAVLTRSDARHFLDRIFQFRLEIPPFPKQDMRDFAKRRLRDGLSLLATDLENSGVDIDQLIDTMIHVGVQSPRNAIQILNAFSESWWLARQREHDGAGTKRPGGLSSGAVTNHPLSLAALSAIRVDFPDFFDDLQGEPALINYFTNVFIRPGRVTDMPSSIEELLKKYGKVDQVSADDQTQPNVGPAYRQLRQYLASLQGHRWPPTLQPLILLSQDVYARELGPRGAQVYDHLVSGDVQGLLDDFGRSYDGYLMSPDNARLITSAMEDIRNRESPPRISNAEYVIGRIIDRIPGDKRRNLLTPVSRRLAESDELRWRFGIPRIRHVLEFVDGDDRRPVVGALIADVLITEGELTFQLETGEDPSLDEATDVAIQVCDLALQTLHAVGLQDDAKSQLLAWLEVRKVSVNGRENEVPFSTLENWMADYEDELLPSFGLQYATLVEEQLQSAPEIDGLDQILGRVTRIWSGLQQSGQASRAEMWKQLIGYAQLQSPSAVEQAISTAQGYLRESTSDQRSDFVQSLVSRFERHIGENDVWSLGTSEDDIANGLIRIIAGSRNELSTEATSQLYPLVVDLSMTQHEPEAEYAVAILDATRASIGQLDGPDQVISDWIERAFTDLPILCVEWLAKHFDSSVSDNQQHRIFDKAGQIVSRDQVEDIEAERLHVLLLTLVSASPTNQQIEEFVPYLFQHVSEPSRSPGGYLKKIFPVVPTLLESYPDQHGEMMLSTLFSRNWTNVSLYGWLHGQMTGHWPVPEAENSSYNPEEIVDTAVKFIENNPADPGVPTVLGSIVELARRAVAPPETQVQIANVACEAWSHHPEASEAALRALEADPSPETIANMSRKAEFGIEGVADQLRTVWSYLSTRMDVEPRIAVTNEMLNIAIAPESETGDEALRIWIEAQGQEMGVILKTELLDAEVNDDQRLRIWLQIRGHLSELGSAFISDVLPRTLLLPGADRTLQAVFDSQEDVSALFEAGSEEKLKLAEILLYSFKEVTSTSTKNRLLLWAKELNLSGVSEILHRLELNDNDLRLIEQSKLVRPRTVDKLKRELQNRHS